MDSRISAGASLLLRPGMTNSRVSSRNRPADAQELAVERHIAHLAAGGKDAQSVGRRFQAAGRLRVVERNRTDDMAEGDAAPFSQRDGRRNAFLLQPVVAERGGVAD